MKTVTPSVLWLSPYRIGKLQFFRQWATEAWIRAGGSVKTDIWLPWKLKMLIGKLGLARSLFGCLKGHRRLVVTVGGKVEYFAWPWCYFYEIVPIVWDCWPKYWSSLERFVRQNQVKLVYCTSSQTADMLRKSCCGVDVVWLPEGIDVNVYPMGPKLVDRNTDVIRFGRDVKGGYLYPTQESLTAAMRDAKIMICRPRCDTNPEHADGLETMTQRYWEGMLSGCVMVGRAPKELIEFCGYNPVVEDTGNLQGTIQHVLDELECYQELVDRNREFAEKHASWDERISLLRDQLCDCL